MVLRWFKHQRPRKDDSICPLMHFFLFTRQPVSLNDASILPSSMTTIFPLVGSSWSPPARPSLIVTLLVSSMIYAWIHWNLTLAVPLPKCVSSHSSPLICHQRRGWRLPTRSRVVEEYTRQVGEGELVDMRGIVPQSNWQPWLVAKRHQGEPEGQRHNVLELQRRRAEWLRVGIQWHRCWWWFKIND